MILTVKLTNNHGYPLAEYAAGVDVAIGDDAVVRVDMARQLQAATRAVLRGLRTEYAPLNVEELKRPE